MAGIGFLLKKEINQDRFSSDLKVNLYSLLISAGPWISGVVCIGALSIFSSWYLTQKEILLFRAIIIYVYAFSLISSSFYQIIFTRFLSDKIYQREYTALFPNFIGAMILCGLTNFSIAAIYTIFTQLSFTLKVLFIVLYCTVGYQWIATVFLSIVKDYMIVTLMFVGGFLSSFAISLFFGAFWNIEGHLIGFTIGQILMLILMLDYVAKTFPLGRDTPFEFTRYFRKYPNLALASFLYYFGFWIDKFIVWYSPDGYSIENSFRAHYPYDTASFIATLTIIPALASFFLHVETDFFEVLRKYINTILNKGIYNEIEKQRINLVSVLRKSFFDIYKVQFMITLIMLLLAPNIVDFLGFSRKDVTIPFMLCLLGAFFQVLFLTLIVLCWNLELLNESLICIIIFSLTNLGFNYYTEYHASYIPPGAGYMLSTAVSFIAVLIAISSRLNILNYLIFSRNPLIESQKEMPKLDQKTEPK